MSRAFAGIGLTFLVSSVPAVLIFDWWLWPIWAGLYFEGNISYLTWHIILNAPIIALSALGLALYVFGRENLCKNTDWHKPALTIGAFFLLFGAYVNFWNQRSFDKMVGDPLSLSQPLNPGEPLASFLAMIWSTIWVVMGALLIVDHVRMERKARAGAMLAVISFTVLVDTGSLLYHFVGLFLYQTLTITLELLTAIGIVIVVYSFIRSALRS